MENFIRSIYFRFSKHPFRNLLFGTFLVISFHSIRFWVRQAGLYSAIKIPVSLFVPVLGYDMLVAPTIEIVNSLIILEPWKWWLFGVLCGVSVVETSLYIFSKINQGSKEIERFARAAGKWTTVLVFLSIPLALLPTATDTTFVAALSAASFTLIFISLRIGPRYLQTPCILVGLLLGLWTLKDYYRQGNEISRRCQLQVLIHMKDNTKEVGCWVSSSDRYIVLMNGNPKSPTAKVIPRELANGFRFLERATQ